jgi:hypothetical protein
LLPEVDVMDLTVLHATSLATVDEARQAVSAIQRQVVDHFMPHWGVGSILHFAPPGTPVPTDHYVIKLVDTSDVDGALGYHTVEGDGQVDGIVGVRTCLDDGVSWSSCLSHEVLELLADPECVRAFTLGSTVIALEVADACEGFGYNVDGVEVSDFCLPAYFTGGPGPYSYTGKLGAPWPALGGGGYYTAGQMGEWSQQNSEQVRPGKLAPALGSRRARRYA